MQGRLKKETILVRTARPIPVEDAGTTANGAIHRASNVLFSSSDALEREKSKGRRGFFYGRFGTPTVSALEEALSDLEGGDGAVIAPSGLAAAICAVRAFVRSGDHLLVSTTSYGAFRKACEAMVMKMGIELGFFADQAELLGLLRQNTKAIFVQNPGADWLQIVDVPYICNVAAARNARVIVDNTWATPVFCNPIKLGADVVVHSLSKYIGGHSDLILGAVVSNAGGLSNIVRTAQEEGYSIGADDAYVALRGLRTLAVRLDKHQASALEVAKWLSKRPEIAAVHHPALASRSMQQIFLRDFSGSTGLFSITFVETDHARARQFCDKLSLFGHGTGWGSFESLVTVLKGKPPAGAASNTGASLRIYIGLEHVEDLIADLESGFSLLWIFSR